MIFNKNFSDIEELFEFSVNYASENNIKTILLFVKTADNVLNLHKLTQAKDIHLIAVTYPMNQVMYIENEEGEIDEIYPEIFAPREQKKLNDFGIPLISSSMPFDPIVIPGLSGNNYSAISQTLNLFGPGIDLAVQSVLMATDNGLLKQGDRVLSLTTKSIVDIVASNSRFLYHPNLGIKFNQIII